MREHISTLAGDSDKRNFCNVKIFLVSISLIINATFVKQSLKLSLNLLYDATLYKMHC
jgi:hypothetical protein